MIGLESDLHQDAAATLRQAGRDITPAQAVETARHHYGLDVAARKLAGERDSNFHLSAPDGRQYMLKFANPAENPGVTNFHTSVMLHVAKSDPSLLTQRVVPALDGSAELRIDFLGEGFRSVRLVTFIEGLMQRDSAVTAKQLFNVGTALARLHLALADFDHPSADHALAWDIKRVGSLRSLMSAMPDQSKRHALENRMDRAEKTLIPALDGMRAQVVHNDLNADNIVLDPLDPSRVVALIDFGDMVKTAAICDVAIAACYQLSDGPDILDLPAQLVAGFHSVVPLEPAEIDMLLELILTRMVARLLITEWRAGIFPENRAYILRNTPKSWSQFERLVQLSGAAAAKVFRRACERTL